MKKIYFEKRSLIICSPDEQALSDSNAILFHPGIINDTQHSGFDIPTLIAMFEASDSLMKIYIPSEDIEATYRRICSEFKEVSAGGGLVSNRRGDYLLINRNGLWDLPKGHQEQGESIETCALREVQEETGVDELQIRKLICVTDHCYFRDNRWHLKHSWWYDMLYTEPSELTPQEEEDISKAAWVAKSSLPAFLANTYPSIAEVFRHV